MTKMAEILSALQEAVTEGAGLPDGERRDLFNRSFQQAGAELAKLAPPDAPAKVDHVSLMMMQLQASEQAVAAIEQGRTLLIGGSGASGETITLAKAWLDLGEVIVAAMAAEQAMPVAAGEQAGEGMSLCKVAVGDGELLVKTTLPEGLQGLIVPPDVIADEIAAIGAALLEFSGADLKKFAPGGEEDDDDRRFEEGEYDDPEEGLESALADIAKIGQMAVMNIAAIKEQLGDQEVGDGEAGALSALDAIAAHGAFMTQQADMLLRAAGGDLEADERNAEGGGGDDFQGDGRGDPDDGGSGGEGGERDERDERDELERGARTRGLQKNQAVDPRVAMLEEALAKATATITANEERLAKLEAQPAPPRAMLGAGTLSLTKQADNGDGQTPKTIDELAEELAKMSPEERTRTIFKLSLNNPMALLQQPGT